MYPVVAMLVQDTVFVKTGFDIGKLFTPEVLIQIIGVVTLLLNYFLSRKIHVAVNSTATALVAKAEQKDARIDGLLRDVADLKQLVAIQAAPAKVAS